jgi:argininosuccinate lyase
MTDGEQGAEGEADAGEESAVRRDRFAGGPARDFLSSLAEDERLFVADLAVDRAHVVMLTEQGILDADTAGDILAALAEVEAAGHGALSAGEDVQEAIETAVIERVGPEGGRMHTARSRNDEVAADIRYALREDLLETIGVTLDARATLLDVAAAEADTVAPGYTHGQPAQPTTVGHWAASYAGALARHTERLLDAYDRVNRNPLGAAAFAGTPFDVDRERTATLLGFDGVVENATDAVAGRDVIVESLAALAAMATTLSNLAEDVVAFASDGHVELADAYTSTSSIMPQKKNPDAVELVRARAGDATGGLTGLLTVLKGLPRAYNRDLQRATTHVWETRDAVTEALEVATGVVATAEWPADVLAEAAGEGFSTATGVADHLARAGVPFRTAHEVVATATAELGPEEAAPDYEALDAAAQAVLGESLSTYVDREAVERALDPDASVRMRDSRGGPAPAALADSLERARGTLAEDREALEERRDAVADARARRERAVDGYV